MKKTTAIQRWINVAVRCMSAGTIAQRPLGSTWTATAFHLYLGECGRLPANVGLQNNERKAYNGQVISTTSKPKGGSFLPLPLKITNVRRTEVGKLFCHKIALSSMI